MRPSVWLRGFADTRIRGAASPVDRESARPRILASTLFILLCSCSFFSRTKNTIYSLDPIPGTPAAATARTPIGIETIELPPGLDRREVVVRQANHQLEVRPNELWSTTLQPLVLHTLAFDLASRLPEGAVVLPGAVKPATMRGIDVTFEELAAGPDQRVVLDAHWDGGHHEHIVVDIASLKSADVAEGLNKALAALADKIVTALPR